MDTTARRCNPWFAAVLSLLVCVAMTGPLVSGVFSQETQADAAIKVPAAKSNQAASVTPGAIAALVGQMEQLSDWLALGKTDAAVRSASDAVLARLDSLIELQRQAEKNAKAQNDPNKKDGQKKDASASQGDQNKSDKNQDDAGTSNDRSRTAGQNASAQVASGQAPGGEGLFYGKGKGTVQAHSFVSSGDWGSLPPEKRQQAMQTINEKFPPQYRILIEQYFRKIAEEP